MDYGEFIWVILITAFIFNGFVGKLSEWRVGFLAIGSCVSPPLKSGFIAFVLSLITSV